MQFIARVIFRVAACPTPRSATYLSIHSTHHQGLRLFRAPPPLASARAPLMATWGGGWPGMADGQVMVQSGSGLARRVAAVLRVRARRVAACPTWGRGRTTRSHRRRPSVSGRARCRGAQSTLIVNALGRVPYGCVTTTLRRCASNVKTP